MENNSSISVVCPAYNSGKFIIGTLNSVISQNILPNEIIIIDDGSSDNTIALVLEYRENNLNIPIKLITQNHLGPGAARNTGIKIAKSEWIAFLDSDDIWLPSKIENVKKTILDNKKINFICHNEFFKDLNGKEKIVDYSASIDIHKPLDQQLYFQNRFSTSAVICKRDLLTKWSGFNINLSSAQDYELWLRMSNDIVPFYIKETLGIYVMRKGNISTSNFWKRLTNILKIKILHRKKVSFILFIFLFFRTCLFHFLIPVLNFFKKIIY